ncbi:hypothetical protein GQ53DRAFT_763609 [Thozetella sp. PMI_491]|nr:hypothetical protein GQ53DRAFT_763609 [Thozetella sp. PMI_491]
MSRVTAPAAKLTRSISSTASISRPSHLLSNGSKAAVTAARKHFADVDGFESADSARTMTTSTASSHRPVPSRLRTVPLMQGFRTSAPKPAPQTASHIDHFVMPTFEDPAIDLYSGLRVPLMPDNARPAVMRAVEQPDAPLARPEILVVAMNPDNVMPAALTEVEGMGIDGVELKFAHDLGRETEQEPGMLRDIWKGLVDDVFGGQQQGAKPSIA